MFQSLMLEDQEIKIKNENNQKLIDRQSCIIQLLFMQQFQYYTNWIICLVLDSCQIYYPKGDIIMTREINMDSQQNYHNHENVAN
ncbi:unnamed protein product [Paramecium primaurelia]|uniref:Uncharacterized protein n=1 Tax=Paramecium primaurelia TaxID=5886 RepID=A0A8S1KZV3_PARPR|nr:unnamed protein product [Paramecium primaurelia]